MPVDINFQGRDGVTQHLDKINRKLDEMESGMRRTSQQSKQVTDSMVSGAVQLAATYATATGAMAALNQALEVNVRLNKEAVQAREQLAEPRAQLAQLAGGDLQRYRELIDTSSQFAQRAAISPSRADTVTFSLMSAGVGEEQLPFYAELQRSRAFGDVAGLTRAAAAMRTSFGEGAPTREQLVSQALAASGYSPSEVAPLLQRAARGAGSAAALSVTSAELLAATAISAEAAGGAEEGSTRLKQLLAEARKQDLGGGLQSVLQQLTERGGVRALSSQEAGLAYESLTKNMDRLSQAIEAATEAPGENLALRTARLAVGEIPDVIARDRAAAEREMVTELRGRGEMTRQAVMETMQTQAELGRMRQPQGPVTQAMLGWSLEKLGINPSLQGGIQGAVQALMDPMSLPGTYQALNRISEQLDEGNRNTRALRDQNTVAMPPN